MLKRRRLHTGWLKLRLKNIESYIDFNVILQWEFCRLFQNSDLSVLREARWTGLFLFFAPARSHALYYIILYP